MKELNLKMKMKEAELWEELERVKAKERQSKLNGKTLLSDHGLQAEKGRTSNAVASKIGTSGKTYARAKLAFREIKRLESEWQEQDVKFLIMIGGQVYIKVL